MTGVNEKMKIGTKVLDYERPYIVGVINLTPDSFSDGEQFLSVEAALSQAAAFIRDGVDFIEIGGESTRPGAKPVSASEEMDRIRPFLTRYSDHDVCPLILDTRKSEVAAFGLQNGVAMINDVSAFSFDPQMLKTIAAAKVPVVIMHSQGVPETMQNAPAYTDVVEDVLSALGASVLKAHEMGIEDIIIDPGIGFGKSLQHNLTLINHLDEFMALECPIMIGTSRKSFIGEITGDPVNDRLEGTIVSSMLAVMNGVNFVRVHDVKSIKKSIQVLQAIVQG